MNNYDKDSQNLIGGKIDNFKQVRFFRNYLKSNSKGISESLNITINKYDKVILILTSQIPKTYYWHQSEDLNEFISILLPFINNNKNFLFVIKEKKNELNNLETDFFNQILNLKNIYLIRSNKPRDLKYNQFEDLLKISDLSVSNVFCSTTIWQSLSNFIPAIAYSRYKIKTFMSKYENFLCDKYSLENSINYWLNINKNDFFIFLDKLKKETNISDENGMIDISNHLIELND